MAQFAQFKVGALACTSLLDGRRMMPLTQMFDSVPEAELLAAAAAIGEEVAVAASMNVLAIQTEQALVLIDSGLPSGLLAESLAAAGIEQAEVGLIVITHGDGDHIGGLHNFPNARYVMPRQAWELWTNEFSRSRMIEEWMLALGVRLPVEAQAVRAADRARYGSTTLPALSEHIQLVDEGQVFLPGFRFIYAPGHRSDHYAIQIHSEGQTLLHVADAVRHPLQATVPTYATMFDSDAAQTAVSARHLFQLAVEQEALLFCAHFDFPGLARVSEAGSVWRWQTVNGLPG